jgi:hypothetical protein
LTVAAPGVLANDADADGDPLSALLVSGPAHGTLALNADGSFTYSPAPAPPPLAAAPAAPAVRPLCQGRPATLVGTARRDALRGTPQPGCSAAPATTCCLATPARTRCAAAWQGPHQRRPRPRPQSPVMSEAACATGIAGLIVPAFALLPGGAQAASNQTELVSRASGAVGSKTNSVYDMPRLSGDRR